MKQRRLLSTSEFGARIGLSSRQVQRMIARGVVRAYKVARWWGIPEAEVGSEAVRDRRRRGRPVGTGRRQEPVCPPDDGDAM